MQHAALHTHLHQTQHVDDFYKFAALNEFNAKLEQPEISLINSYSNNIFQSSSHSFSTSQIACICRTLYLNREGEKLNDFFESYPLVQQLFDQPESLNNDVAAVFCAHLFALYHRGEYLEVLERIKFSNLESQFHGELQKLWYEAHYAEDQRKKTKKLGPVDKYRIRQKNPPPGSIWDGEKVIYAFKEKQRKILLDYYRRNRYPKPEEKQEIARRTGLKMPQIANWFKNKRQRNKSTPASSQLNPLILEADNLVLNTSTFF